MQNKVTQYFSDHWIPMALSLAASSIVSIIGLITIYTNLRIDYFVTKQTTNANAATINSITISQTKLMQQVIQMGQQVVDDHQQIQTIDTNVEDIHRYFFKTP